MDELKAMRTFARVVDSGGFAPAARALDVAPAAVTRAIADLEQRLGARLMTRTTRRNALTDIGQRYLERVRRILHEVDDATALARQAQACPQGTVRVLAPPAFAAHQLATRLVRFHHRHPQVTVDVSATGPVESIDEEYDITVIVRDGALDGDFVAQRLARTAVLLCAAPEYLNRHGRPTHPRQLAEHPLLLPPSRRSLAFVHIASGESVVVVPRRRLINSVCAELHAAGALAGGGVAGLASFVAAQAMRERRLEHVLPEWRLFDLSIWACMPTRRHVPASTRALMDFLLAEFGGRDADPWTAARTEAPPSLTENPLLEPAPCA